MKFAFIRLFMAKPIFLLLINICDNRMRESLCSMSKTALFGGKKQRKEQKGERSEEHTSELQSQFRISYAVFCLKKKKKEKEKKKKKKRKKEKKK